MNLTTNSSWMGSQWVSEIVQEVPVRAFLTLFNKNLELISPGIFKLTTKENIFYYLPITMETFDSVQRRLVTARINNRKFVRCDGQSWKQLVLSESTCFIDTDATETGDSNEK